MLAYLVRCGALVLATCGAIAAMSSVARADLVLMDANGTQVVNPAASLTDLGAQGFATAPRMLTLQTEIVETGSVLPVDAAQGDAVSGANKSTTPTLATLGWTGGGSPVGVGFDPEQTANGGLTMQSLVLTIYNGTTPVVGGSFSLFIGLVPLDFTAVDLALQQSNGSCALPLWPECCRADPVQHHPGAARFVRVLRRACGNAWLSGWCACCLPAVNPAAPKPSSASTPPPPFPAPSLVLDSPA